MTIKNIHVARCDLTARRKRLSLSHKVWSPLLNSVLIIRIQRTTQQRFRTALLRGQRSLLQPRS